MKRYFLFGGDTYYPSGGMSDFIGDFSTIEKALKEKDKHEFDWFEIYDTKLKIKHDYD